MKMKYTDLDGKDANALSELLKEKKLLLFKLRGKLRTMQLNNPNEIKEVKKDIARIQTAITVTSSEA
jgi:large subunit ribosomal protein L29